MNTGPAGRTQLGEEFGRFRTLIDLVPVTGQDSAAEVLTRRHPEGRYLADVIPSHQFAFPQRPQVFVVRGTAEQQKTLAQLCPPPRGPRPDVSRLPDEHPEGT